MPRLLFPPFEADLSSGELWRDSVPVPVQDLPFRLLALLLERPGEVVSREAIIERLWGKDTFVDATSGVNTAIAKLRDALGDTAEAPRFIETLPRRGYRFIASIAAVAAVAPIQPAAGRAAPDPRRRRLGGLLALLGGCLTIFLVVFLAATRRDPLRVAVVLFDNETGAAEWDRGAQGLTDATVAALTRLDDLEVIGNAAVLRTARPFRDIEKIRDALSADFVLVGQVQRVDQAIVVRCHLIRARDQAHVWFATVTAGGGAGWEAQLQEDVGSGFAAAVGEHRSAG